MTFSLSPLADAPRANAPADSIKDVDLANFMVDVIETSKQNIVVVEFWSPRSTLCKQLEPLLVKVVRSYKGAIQLAKVNIDNNPEIAQQMGVQSVPAVFAFFQGRPVDGFAGALPEAQIKSWIERLLKATGAEVDPNAGGLDAALKQAADFLAAKDHEKAKSIYADILEIEPMHPIAYAGFLRSLLAEGDLKGAKEMLAKVPAEISKDKAFDPIRTTIELSEQSVGGSSLKELEAKVAENPADYQARFDLAMACYAAQEKEQALDHLLEIVRLNRAWNEDAARKQLLKFFEAFGVMDPLTIAARKRLSSLLFA